MADAGEVVKLDALQHVLLDESILRLPYELSRNNFRTAHRHMEQSQSKLDELLKSALKAGPAGRSASGAASGPNKAVSAIDQAIARLQTLQRKLGSLSQAQQTYMQQSEARIEHLDALFHIPTVADVEYDRWSRTRLDRLMVDYLLRNGYMASATALAKSKAIEALVDIDELEHVNRIESSLRMERRLDLALTWCGENKQALKRIDSIFEYQLRQQQYTELVKASLLDPTKLYDAVLHARKYLVTQARTAMTIASAGYMAYAFEENADEAEFSVHHKIFGLPSDPLLHTALTAGMSALKTPACHATVMSPTSGLNTMPKPILPANTFASSAFRSLAHEPSSSTPSTSRLLPHEPSSSSPSTSSNSSSSSSSSPSDKHEHEPMVTDDPIYNPAAPFHTLNPTSLMLNTPVCPICSTELNKLARNVPFAMHSKSNVEDNPVVLPNGRIYGEARLRTLNDKMGTEPGFIVDPADCTLRYSASQMRKVYIL